MSLSIYCRTMLLRYWWVALFAIACLMWHEHQVLSQKNQFVQLHQKISSLQKRKQVALQRRLELQQRLISSQDKASIELTLMLRLGLIPEGKQKIVFKDQD